MNISVLNEHNQNLIHEVYPNTIKKYPNHLRNIFVVEQLPRVILREELVLSKSAFFFDTIDSMENSKINYLYIKDKSNISLKLISDVMDDLTSKRNYELTFNTLLEPMTVTPRFMTYEMDAFCLMIPIPKPTTKGKRILLKVS
jgi:hypothetical protein